ncbi:MAG TPA: hypothetical protein VJK72_02910 [Candidatus Nanoarchaeia archaeon]|nr:hypothetical protein [Candidatus Nanoarchaeia archaeon]
MNIAELRASVKTKRKDALHRLVDYLAYYPAWLLLKTPLTVTHITLLWIVGQIFAALLVSLGNDSLMIVGVALFQLLFILDCADSIVGRYRKQFSLNTVYLDYVGHYIANPLLLVCYGIGVARMQGDIRFVFVGGVAALAFLLNKAVTLNPGWYAEDKHKLILDVMKKSSLQAQDSFLYTLFSLFRIEYLFNIFFFGTLLGYAHATIVIYAVVYCGEALRKIIAQLMANLERR